MRARPRLVLLLVAVLAYFLTRPKTAAAPEAKQEAQAVRARSLAILPFRNSSGDAKDDWIGSSVADMLSTDIGQSAHLHTVPTDRLHQVLSDLHVGPETTVDPDTLRRVAQFSNADVLVSGQYARFGDQIVIDATIRDLVHDQTVPGQSAGAGQRSACGHRQPGRLRAQEPFALRRCG